MFFALVFAGLYQTVAVDYGDHPTFLSSVYYSVVTLTTLGYGDVVPASAVAQGVTTPRPIAGQVSGVDGAPAAGAAVHLRWRAHPELPGVLGYSLLPKVGGGEPGMGELTVKTDAKGRFRVKPPHRGPFVLVAHGAAGDTCSARVFPAMAGSFHRLELEPGSYHLRTGDGREVSFEVPGQRTVVLGKGEADFAAELIRELELSDLAAPAAPGTDGN